MTGAQLRKYRKALGYTQKQLAEAIGVTTNSVARWERSEMKIAEPAARLIQLLSAQKER